MKLTILLLAGVTTLSAGISTLLAQSSSVTISHAPIQVAAANGTAERGLASHPTARVEVIRYRYDGDEPRPAPTPAAPRVILPAPASAANRGAIAGGGHWGDRAPMIGLVVLVLGLGAWWGRCHGQENNP